MTSEALIQPWKKVVSSMQNADKAYPTQEDATRSSDTWIQAYERDDPIAGAGTPSLQAAIRINKIIRQVLQRHPSDDLVCDTPLASATWEEVPC
jgi:hypothetical protein